MKTQQSKGRATTRWYAKKDKAKSYPTTRNPRRLFGEVTRQERRITQETRMSWEPY